MNDLDFRPFTYAHMIEEYIRHPEAKSLGPDGKPCTAETRGLLQRAHITAGRIRYIDKETSSMWAQGDDLSVITDEDETGFRVIEYGKNRKIVLPDLSKREIEEMKLRELRRRGIGQHTIEKALHAHVRARTLRKILEAIDAYQKEHRKSDDPAPGCAISQRKERVYAIGNHREIAGQGHATRGCARGVSGIADALPGL